MGPVRILKTGPVEGKTGPDRSYKAPTKALFRIQIFLNFGEILSISNFSSIQNILKFAQNCLILSKF